MAQAIHILVVVVFCSVHRHCGVRSSVANISKRMNLRPYQGLSLPTQQPKLGLPSLYSLSPPLCSSHLRGTIYIQSQGLTRSITLIKVGDTLTLSTSPGSSKFFVSFLFLS
ncbi:hypothetical protein B0O99DRAFT_193914 [Bisporella sp. PMI_857]|nr:hypothetical protein B0O99DRAFT_193914 [Bisporella sp. PMI_857]